jgi:hypothetical protein
MQSLLPIAQDTIAVVFQDVTVKEVSSEMTGSQKFSVIIALGTSSIALLGTLSIVFISPLMTRMNERKKAKEILKASIIKNIHMLFNYSKRLLESVNNNEYRAKTLYNYDASIRTNPPNVDKIKDDRKYLMETFNKANETTNSIGDKIIELESDLISQSTQLANYHNKPKFKKVHDFIVQNLKTINKVDDTILYDYPNLTSKEYKRLASELDKEILFQQAKLENTCYALIDFIDNEL